MTRLNKIEYWAAVTKAASPGPWEWWKDSLHDADNHPMHAYGPAGEVIDCTYEMQLDVEYNDQCFISEAREAMPWLTDWAGRALPILRWYAANCACACGESGDMADAAKKLLEEVEGE